MNKYIQLKTEFENRSLVLHIEDDGDGDEDEDGDHAEEAAGDPEAAREEAATQTLGLIDLTQNEIEMESVHSLPKFFHDDCPAVFST